MRFTDEEAAKGPVKAKHFDTSVLKKKEVAEKFYQFHVLLKRSWVEEVLKRGLTVQEEESMLADCYASAFREVMRIRDSAH